MILLVNEYMKYEMMEIKQSPEYMIILISISVIYLHCKQSYAIEITMAHIPNVTNTNYFPWPCALAAWQPVDTSWQFMAGLIGHVCGWLQLPSAGLSCKRRLGGGECFVAMT